MICTLITITIIILIVTCMSTVTYDRTSNVHIHSVTERKREYPMSRRTATIANKQVIKLRYLAGCHYL